MKSSHLLRWMSCLACAAVAVAQTDEPNATVAALKLVKFVQPDFPTKAYADGVPVGCVTAAIGRDASGTVTDVLVLAATHPAMAAAASAAIRDWRFPAISESELSRLEPPIVRIDFTYRGVIVIYAQTAAVALAETVSGGGALPEAVVRSDARPRVVSQAMPAYPRALAPAGLEGEANVVFYVDADGRVRLPRVLSATHPAFADAALQAVADWRYEPPHGDGRPMLVSDRWSFHFRKGS